MNAQADYVEMDSGLIIPLHVGEELKLKGCRPKAVDALRAQMKAQRGITLMRGRSKKRGKKR